MMESNPRAEEQRDPGIRDPAAAPRLGREGFVLPTAVVALVVVALLVLGAFASVRQEFRIGLGSDMATRALYAAEQGTVQVMEGWDQTVYGSMKPLEMRRVTGTADGAEWTVDVTRTAERTYFLASTGRIGSAEALAGASRSLGLMVKLRTPDLVPGAGLTTRGTVTVRGSAEVRGEDVNPPTWPDCELPGPAAAGVLTNAGGTVTATGQALVSGSPNWQATPTVTAQTFTEFGDMNWADLVGLADKRYPTGSFNNTGPRLTADGQCDLAYLSNWGDPLNPAGPCGSYFPIVHINGDARIQSGGVGQGILLVEGDLTLQGGFTWYGLVLVQGNLSARGTGSEGAKLFGGVWVRGSSEVADDVSTMTGNVGIQYSSCAASRAVLMNASLVRARPLTARSWSDLSAALEQGG